MTIENWYKHNYSKINSTANENSFSSGYLHKSMENTLPNNVLNRIDAYEILEVGANNGEHIPYVMANWKSYIASDIKEPKKESWSKIQGKVDLKNDSRKLTFMVADVQVLPFEDNRFDRVISTCVLHHLIWPENALNEVRRVLKPGGVATFLLPNDPGLAYRAARRLTSVRIAKQNRVQDELNLVHALEHRNHFLGLRDLIRVIFKEDKINEHYKPFRLPLYNLNLITIFQVIKEASV